MPTSGALTPLLARARIALEVKSTGHAAALYEVALLLDGHPDVTDFQGFYRDLLAREQADSTCLGNEIALPHARTDHVTRIVMAVGRSAPGVPIENSDQKVRFFFVVGTPKSDSGACLQAVATLCRIVKDSANREDLLGAPTAADFIRILRDLETRLAGRIQAPNGS